MRAPKYAPVGCVNVTMPHWVRGDVNQGTNRIFGIDPVDGSPKLVAEVFGYTQDEVSANVDFILSACRDKFWRMTP